MASGESFPTRDGAWTIGPRVVPVLVAALLLSAAALKAYALLSGASSAHLLFGSPRWQFAAIEFEAVLGLWLLSGQYRRQARLVGMGAFILFAVISLFLALEGRRSCGCFGVVEVNPWYMFGLDTATVIALWRWRAARSSDSLFSTTLFRRGASLTVGVAAMLAAAYVLLGLFDPSTSTALARLRGDSFTVEPAIVDLGTGAPSESRLFTVRVRNHTPRPRRVIGLKGT